MKKKVKINYLATRSGYVVQQSDSEKHLPTSVITQELYVNDTGAPVFAMPKPDTVFSGWNDGVKSNPRTDVALREYYPQKDIIANFKTKGWWIRFIDWIWRRRNPIIHSKH